MMHEGKRIDDQVKRLEKELDQPTDSKKRLEIQAAINHLKRKKQEWKRPH